MEQKLIKKTNVRIGGFTLIEMVVVIGVIGVLMTLAFRGTATIQAGARDVKRVKTLNDTKALLEQYYAAEGRYPKLDTTCNPNSTQTGATRWNDLATELKAKGIIEDVKDLQNDPTIAQQYCYSSTAEGEAYRMTVWMERSVPKDHVESASVTVGGATKTIAITGCVANTATTRYYCVKP